MGIPLAVQLLDRLSAFDESQFIVTWLTSAHGSRGRLEPALAVRLVRAYREIGRVDRARELAAALPSAPPAWNPLDACRLATERAILAASEGRARHAEAELRVAARSLGTAPKGAGVVEQLDLHLTTAQVELKLDRVEQAIAAFQLAEHVAERIEDATASPRTWMTLGHLALRLSDPRAAVKHYTGALTRSPAVSPLALDAHTHLALALASTGRFDEARAHALESISLARELAAGIRHADAHDVLALVEIGGDRPTNALHAIDEALAVLGDTGHPALRYELAEHRTWALAALGRAESASQWLARSEKIRAEKPSTEILDELHAVATRGRVLEACGAHDEALEIVLPHVATRPAALVTGSINLVAGRAALARGDEKLARECVERAALAGDKYGWVFPERMVSVELWRIALKSGDSRIVRYAEKMIQTPQAPPSILSMSIAPPASAGRITLTSIPPASEVALASTSVSDMPQHDGETLIYVTTLQGVQRVPLAELSKATEGATLVVDTLRHALRVHDRAVSLERRRALEPLVVQLLRRAKEGLTAEEILRAAGGPGPESADAEHRVRVLISRVRDLLGDPTAIERVRDAGERGRTRYRLAPNVNFALVEPLFST
ncbi:MAG: tetratricopeptide repeat protein [Polyangiaceae bacterium]